MSQMSTRINPRLPQLWHGADYNPEQWPESVWDEDLRLMRLAGCNVMAVGIFSWALLQPEPERFDFDWLDRVFERLHGSGVQVLLATPSAAIPRWLAHAEPEVRRMRADRTRELPGGRHNHCPTSPVYRQAVAALTRRLGERYGEHPALVAWHVGNEFSGSCHCPLCQDAFRSWLQRHFGNDLEALNTAWNTAFWSRRYQDWSQIESPAPHGEYAVHGLTLAWRRFVSDQHCDFIRAEVATIRASGSPVPVTTNFHPGGAEHIDYHQLARLLDVVSWDSYPMWHRSTVNDAQTACETAFAFDSCRCTGGGKPWLLMESTPSLTNWQPVSKLKRPGMHLLSSMQAIAHGSDSVQYFQWRKSPGAFEQFHGAVVDHVGHEHTRVFQEVADVGRVLAKLEPVAGSRMRASVALIHDWQVQGAIDELKGWGRGNRDYRGTCINHYRQFWRRGIAVDIIDQSHELSAYKLVLAPMLHLLRPGFAERLRAFVQAGGVAVMTYGSAMVDAEDRPLLGGWPGGGLREVFGIWNEELDALHPGEKRSVVFEEDNDLGLTGQYEVTDYWESIHLEGAKALARFGEDMFAGQASLTVNHFGEGQAYYMAARGDERFLNRFYGELVDALLLPRALPAPLPAGITAQCRSQGDDEYVFVLNFSQREESIDLGTAQYTNLLTGDRVTGMVRLAAHGFRVLRR